VTRKHTSRSPLRRAPFSVMSIVMISIALVALTATAQMHESKAQDGHASGQPVPGNASIADNSVSNVPRDGARAHPVPAQGARSGNDLIVPSLPIFLPIVSYGAGASVVRALAVADLNHDGFLDVAVANENGVGVLLGNGDGTLQTGVTYDSGGIYAFDVKVADLNRDGKLDIVAVNECSHDDVNCRTPTVGVLLGNGDGTYQPVVAYDPGGSGPGAIAVADVNGDGKPDLIVALCSGCNANPGAVAVLLGNGDGTFQPAVTYASGGDGTGGVTVADVDGDGKMDIMVVNLCTQYCPTGQAEGSVGLLLGNGDGTFRSAVTYDPNEYAPHAVVVADLNADGKQDLAVTGCRGSDGQVGCYWSTVSVLLGSGDGTFQPAAPYYIAYAGSTAALAVADLNEDGKLDLAVAGELLLGNGDGTFQVAQAAGYIGDFGVSLADMNRDGRPDLVAADLCVGSCSSSGVDVQLHVGDTVTSTSLTSTPNPAVYGQTTFTATVGSGSGTPTGTVIFYNESYGGEIGSATLAGGTAALSGAYAGVGTNPIVAVYQGSLKYHPSISTVLDQVVTKATTTTSVTASLNPVMVGKPVIYTVSVTSQYGGVAGGTITCLDNGSYLRPVKRHLSQFRAKYTTAGTHAIACTYSGDANTFGSTAPTLTELVLYQTTTALTTSGSPSHVGQPVTFTAVVTSTFGAIPNGELVKFSYGGKVLGTAPLSSGTAALTTSSLPKGTHIVLGKYQGDAAFKSSQGKITQVVIP